MNTKYILKRTESTVYKGEYIFRRYIIMDMAMFDGILKIVMFAGVIRLFNK